MGVLMMDLRLGTLLWAVLLYMVEALVPANTCFKSVDTKTGEVNKGCAPMKFNHNNVFTTDVGPNGEHGVKTYFCNTKLCNSGNSMVPVMVLTLMGVVVQYYI